MSTPVAPLVVLVVEDEQLLRELVEPALADAGYSVYWPTMALRRSNTSRNESRRRPHSGLSLRTFNWGLAQAVGRLPSERANSTQRFLWSM